jgi:hypothetical protein
MDRITSTMQWKSKESNIYAPLQYIRLIEGRRDRMSEEGMSIKATTVHPSPHSSKTENG